MSKVFFIPIDSYDQTQEISQSAARLLGHLMAEGHIHPASYIPLKVHFGEKGNQTYITPENYTGIIQFLKEKGISSAYTDTNALYRGQRQNRTDHLKLAEEHGFTQLPLVIADGEYGEEYVERPFHGKYFQSCKIGKAFTELEQMIILSHFKGHMLAGFGGALKQLAMGCASRGGKLAQHSGTIPKVKARKCEACGDCAEKCPAGAIVLQPKAMILEDKCIGCASCIAVCKKGAISFSWQMSLGKEFRERLAEYAMAAQTGKTFMYLNFLINITRGCDCESRRMKPIVPNIGLLGSMDPVAVDTASLDLVQKAKGKKVFQRGKNALKYAEKIGMGTMHYELVELSPTP
ncbi:MAG: DUF362 domain-containing protein [Deltaproteobacteria bacterium]|nr:DUF362 domain-containing protein [Deltaproteobacteria bacterium]